MDMFERLAEDFARKRLGTAGVLPVRMIEVRVPLQRNACVRVPSYAHHTG